MMNWKSIAIVVLGVGPSVAAAQATDLQLAAAKELCSRYGFTPGTDGFAKCVQGKVEGGAPPMTEEERFRAQMRCESQMRGDSGGSYGSYLANAAKCKSDTNAHLKQAPPSRGTTCRRNLDGSVSCDPD